jgi:hypothetical protein
MPRKKSPQAARREQDYSEAGTRWHKAVLETMHRWIGEAGHPVVDAVTERILRRRLEQLELLVGMLQGDLLAHLPKPRPRLMRSIYDSEIPITPSEAAALILWESGPAKFLARKRLGRKRFEDYEDFGINMDWFYRPLESPRDVSIDRRWAHRSIIQPWPPG